jgi:uncharacterized protein
MTFTLTDRLAPEFWDQPKGQLQQYWWRTTWRDEKTYVDVPVIILSGSSHGPRVSLIAGVHGDEVEGQFVLQDLAEELNPEELTGTVVLIVCANPMAAESGKRRTPLDGVDLNRVFPGNLEGSVTERLAAALFSLVTSSTFVMTLHGWFVTGNVVPYVEHPQGSGAAVVESYRAARASGLERLMPLDWQPGLLSPAAVRCGIPAIEVEVGGQGQSTAENRALYHVIVKNFLRHLGVLPGEPQPASRAVTMRRHHVYAHASGMLRLNTKLGLNVQCGEVLGTIVGLNGEVISEVTAPVTSEVGSLRTFAPILEGDHVLDLFEAVGYADL